MKNNYRFNTTYNLVVSIIGLLLGILLITMKETIAVYVFQIIGIITIVLSTIRLISIFTINEIKIKSFYFVETIVNLLLGFVMFLYPVGTIGIILGSILIIAPIYNIIVSKNKKETFKKELVKIALGVILVILGPASTLGILFYIAGAIISVCSLISLVIYIIALIKDKKKTKKVQKDTEVIDV